MKKKVDDDVSESVFKSQWVKEALELIRDRKRASTSVLQRGMKISYNKAAMLMDHLEAHGVIGPVNGQEPREILMDLDAELPELPEMEEKPAGKSLRVMKPADDNDSKESTEGEGPLKSLSDIPPAERPVVKKRKTKLLKCDLSAEELRRAGQDLADNLEKIEQLDDSLKSFKSEIKAQMESAKEKVASCSRLVRQKYELRQVDVEMTMDYQHESCEIRRIDTGEVVETRQMSAEELNELPLEV